MTPGSKLVLILLGVGGLVGVAVLAGSKKASAAPLPDDEDEGTVVVPPTDDGQPVVVPSEPEGGFSRTDPFAVSGVQDAAEASRLLLRWWSSEGESLVDGDTAADRPKVPRDFGSQPADLSGNFGARTKQIAAAFEHYSGMTPEDGVLTNSLLLALRRWAQSQQLPREALPAAKTASAPAPIVLPAASPLTTPAVIPVPPVMPPLPSATAPVFVPSPPAQQPPVSELPPVAPPVVPLPPIVPQPTVVPVPVQPAAPAATAAASQPSTVSQETAEMVNELLLAERNKGWNRVEPFVKAWQKSRGLVVDGKFGPKSALMVAEEFGTIPIVRFWPKGSQKAPALLDYRTKLLELANTASGTRKAQLKVSSQREQAQSFGVLEGKAAALPEALQVQIAKVA